MQARERFTTAYKTTSYEGNFLPSDDGDLITLLDAFEIEKAIYELDYERSHRPEWERIPRQGLKNIVERRWLRSSE
jgi:maltose alpha-D-glucosyltransferase/alpha-amylase